MTRDTSSDCSDTPPDPVAVLVRRYQAIYRALALDLQEEQQEELRQEQRKVLSDLYDMLEEPLREQVLRSFDQPAQARYGQPASVAVRNEVMQSMVLNMFTALVAGLPTFALDGVIETRLLALASRMDIVQGDRKHSRPLAAIPLPRRAKK